MSYQEILQRASFRGISFEVEASDRRIGFNYAMHVFPGGKRRAYAEELSEEPEILSIDAFLIGKDAAYTRDLLLNACRKRSPGKLCHPQIGYINARCKSFRVRDVLNRVGKIYLNMEFIEESEPVEAVVLGFDVLAALRRIDQLMSDTAADLVKNLSVLDLPAYSLARLAQSFDKISLMLVSGNGLGRIAESIGRVDKASSSVREHKNSLVKSPTHLVEGLLDSVKRSSLQAKFSTARSQSAKPISSQQTRSVAQKQELSGIVSVASSTLALCVLSIAIDLLRMIGPGEDAKPQEIKALKEVICVNKSHLITEDRDRLEGLYQILASIPGTKSALKENESMDRSRPALVLAYEKYADIFHRLACEKAGANFYE